MSAQRISRVQPREIVPLLRPGALRVLWQHGVNDFEHSEWFGSMG
jgi:hypothetical protein